MRKFSAKQKLAVVVGTTAVAVIGSGLGAFAFWSSSGTGTGTATTGIASNALSITDTTAITDLAPGVTVPEGISGKIKNTSATQNEHVGTVTVTFGAIDETAAGQAAASSNGHTCSSSDYALGGTVAMPVNLDLTPGQEVPFSGATIVFVDSPTVNQDACQGATVHLTYTSN